MSHKQSIEKIKFEMLEISKLIDKYSILINLVKSKEPDLIEMTAMATVLHSFYNGIEKVFIIIAKEIDMNIPSSRNWHRDLLLQMRKENENRSAIVTEDLIDILNEYLAFRHFYRHAYSFQLNWDKLKGLSLKLTDTWGKFNEEINLYIQNIKNSKD